MPTDYNVQAQIAYLKWVNSIDRLAAEDVRLYRDYASGDQKVYLTDRQKEFIGLKSGNKYVHNLCGLIVDMAVERLRVTGFETIEGQAGALSQRAMEWWDANRMDAQQDILYRAAVRDGAAYLIVDWDVVQQMPRWTVNYADDGTAGIWPYIDGNTGGVSFWAKHWQIYNPLSPDNNGLTRLVLYFPDRVEKYVSTKDSNTGIAGTRWDRWEDSKGEPWPVPWVDQAGAPLGMAVIEFNNPNGSEVSDLIPLQDMLNKSDVDLIAAADAAGFRLLYVTGVMPQTDSTGKEKSITVQPGTVMRFTEPAGVGAIEPMDLSQLIRACRYWSVGIAGLSRTPQYLMQEIGADQPSGESLRMQEMGLIAKCGRKQATFGNAWEDVLYLSRRLWNMYRPGEQIPDGRVQTQWAAVETKDEMALMQVLTQKMQMGVSDEQLWQEMGYNQKQIEGFQNKKSQEGTVGANLLRDFLTGAQRNERSVAGGNAVPAVGGVPPVTG